MYHALNENHHQSKKTVNQKSDQFPCNDILEMPLTLRPFSFHIVAEKGIWLEHACNMPLNSRQMVYIL